MSILITGSAGFIGFHLTNYFAKKKVKNIIAIDNFNPYYDAKLKDSRKKLINKSVTFKYLDLRDNKKLYNLFKKYKFKKIIHLAAQPGVRYSLINPTAYFENNLVAFYNLIELSRKFKIRHFIYASSSSVYGNLKKYPLKENYNSSNPISFYATTKKCNELIADSYFLNFKLNCTGLRFFTVYGPFGRPDMSLYKFVNSALSNKKINVYNKGNHIRDFTYINDVVNAVYKIFKKKGKSSHQIYNIAGGKPNSLKKYIYEIEKILKRKIKKKNILLQKGDVFKTHADITKLKKDFKFKSKYNLREGLDEYISWFKEYYLK